MGGLKIESVGMSTSYGTCEPVPSIAKEQELNSLNVSSFVMASQGGGQAIKNPSDCKWELYKLFISAAVGTLYSKTYSDYEKMILSPNLDNSKEVEVFERDVRLNLVLMLSFAFQDVLSLQGSPFFDSFFYRTMTPPGWIQQIYMTWNACGRPGGGLPKRVAEGFKKFAAKVPVPAHAPQMVPIPIPYKMPYFTPSKFDPNLNTWEVLAGAMIFTLLFPPFKYANSFALNLSQSQDGA